MYKKLDQCPSCSHPSFDNYLICEDHTSTKESFALVKCKNCELVFTNPRPDTESLAKYYKSDEYISHTDKGNSIINILYKQIRKITLSKKLTLIKKFIEKGSILDYGCGTGDFLAYCEKNKWSTTGFEPNQEAREIAKSKSKSIFTDTIPLEYKVDVITAWHVIEHVEELNETIEMLKKSLNKDGYMFIALPNHQSEDAKIYKEYWAAYDVPRHLYHFDKKSLSHLIKNHKLRLIDSKPMVFDSYYVSMLSEKYKKGKNNFLSAIINGYKSNKKATKTGEYSSLIYILQK